jgi:hypothetical protein
LFGVKNNTSEIHVDHNIDRSNLINEEYWDDYHSNEFKNIFIPCINCNNLIHFLDCGKFKIYIKENHSNICIKVKEEVLKIESSNFCFHVVDYKLEKIKEHVFHIQSMKSRFELLNDIHYFSIISKYIQDAIEIKSIKDMYIDTLEKILSNIEVI